MPRRHSKAKTSRRSKRSKRSKSPSSISRHRRSLRRFRAASSSSVTTSSSSPAGAAASRKMRKDVQLIKYPTVNSRFATLNKEVTLIRFASRLNSPPARIGYDKTTLSMGTQVSVANDEPLTDNDGRPMLHVYDRRARVWGWTHKENLDNLESVFFQPSDKGPMLKQGSTVELLKGRAKNENGYEMVEVKREDGLVGWTSFENLMPDDICAICLDVITNDLFTGRCSHQFHKSCIRRWMGESQTNLCPVCSRNL